MMLYIFHFTLCKPLFNISDSPWLIPGPKIVTVSPHVSRGLSSGYQSWILFGCVCVCVRVRGCVRVNFESATDGNWTRIDSVSYNILFEYDWLQDPSQTLSCSFIVLSSNISVLQSSTTSLFLSLTPFLTLGCLTLPSSSLSFVLHLLSHSPLSHIPSISYSSLLNSLKLLQWKLSVDWRVLKFSKPCKDLY